MNYKSMYPFRIEIKCPECNLCMVLKSETTLYCLNPDCKQFRIVYEAPSINLKLLTKERPIVFHKAMVRAILNNRKSQTRIVIDPKPKTFNGRTNCEWLGWPLNEKGGLLRCPYGQVGDRLWVKEGFYKRIITEPRLEGQFCYFDEITYEIIKEQRWKKIPAIHMPKKFSRVTLEIIGLRVERLHDITDADLDYEGCNGDLAKTMAGGTDMVDPDSGLEFAYITNRKFLFQEYWNFLNGVKHPWDSNPWVWVVSFMRMKK